MNPKIKEWIYSALFIGVVVTSVSALRATMDGREYLKQGDEAYEEGELKKALRNWRRAARWYVPFASHDDLAYGRMQNLANKAHTEKDIYLELLALRGIRSSVWATRHITNPHKGLLPKVNKRLSEIMAGMEDPNLDPDKTLAERQEWHLNALNKDEAPKKSWTLVAALGFIFWLCSVCLLYTSPSPRDATLSRMPSSA